MSFNLSVFGYLGLVLGSLWLLINTAYHTGLLQSMSMHSMIKDRDLILVEVSACLSQVEANLGEDY